MAQRWSHDPQYSHGFLVPLFAAVVLWHRRRQYTPDGFRPDARGGVLLGVAVLLTFPARLKLTRRTAFAHATAIIVVSLLVINAGYYFDHRAFTEADNQWIVRSFPSRSALFLSAAHALRYLVPTDSPPAKSR